MRSGPTTMWRAPGTMALTTPEMVPLNGT